MKVVVHYWEGSPYTYTGCCLSLLELDWYSNNAVVSKIKSPECYDVDLTHVKHLEEIDARRGRYCVYYRPPTPSNRSKALSVRVDTLSSRQRIKETKKECNK